MGQGGAQMGPMAAKWASQEEPSFACPINFASDTAAHFCCPKLLGQRQTTHDETIEGDHSLTPSASAIAKSEPVSKNIMRTIARREAIF